MASLLPYARRVVGPHFRGGSRQQRSKQRRPGVVFAMGEPRPDRMHRRQGSPSHAVLHHSHFESISVLRQQGGRQRHTRAALGFGRSPFACGVSRLRSDGVMAGGGRHAARHEHRHLRAARAKSLSPCCLPCCRTKASRRKWSSCITCSMRTSAGSPPGVSVDIHVPPSEVGPSGSMPACQTHGSREQGGHTLTSKPHQELYRADEA